MKSALKMAAYEAANGTEMARMEMGYAGEAEGAFRDGRGRRRYDDGRFAPKNNFEDRMMARNDMNDAERYHEMPEHTDGRTRRYAASDVIPITRGREYRIGFSSEDTNSHHGKHGKGSELHHGHASGMSFDKEIAEDWMRNIRNADESVGAHWPLEHIKQMMAQKDIDMDPLELWVAVNMMYADYYPVAKAMNMNNIGFYMELAKCFLEDEDAVKDKLAAYYHSVVKH